MKIKSTLYIFLIIILSSCGVILDTTKIYGTWELDKTEFYQYNPELSTYKIYRGKDDDTLDDELPLEGEFFGLHSKTITIEFKENQTFIITYVEADTDITKTLINEAFGEWSVNQYDNSIIITSISNEIDSGNFWVEGFTLENAWPMPTEATMELTIKAEQLDDNTVPLENGEFTFEIMKAFLIKQ